MSVGDLRYERKSDAELYRMLGEGDTAKLYARKPELDTAHDIPYCGGNSVDGRSVYIDREFHRGVMSGAVAVKGMAPSQLIQSIIEHEHAEWAIDAGDNPVDTYPAAHEFGTAKEHRFVTQLGCDPERYEAQIRRGIEQCIKRFIALGSKANPPRDLWCGPYLDDPDADDKEILRIMRAKGVDGASKVSKISVHYGIGAEECKDCAMFADKPSGPIRTCDLVTGPIRDNRHCDKWEAK